MVVIVALAVTLSSGARSTRLGALVALILVIVVLAVVVVVMVVLVVVVIMVMVRITFCTQQLMPNTLPNLC